MIDVLIQGKLHGDVVIDTASNGNAYAKFRLSATDKGGQWLTCSCILFAAEVIEVVRRLQDGDAVAVSGEASIRTWCGKDGVERHSFDVLVHGALSPYHAGRKRAEKPTAGGEL